VIRRVVDVGIGMVRRISTMANYLLAPGNKFGYRLGNVCLLVQIILDEEVNLKFIQIG
jgi:hypothetical protein